MRRIFLCRQFACFVPFSLSIICTTCTTISTRVPQKKRFINIREQVWTTSGRSPGGPKRHRNPNTPTFADRDPNDALWAEDGATKAALQWAQTMYRIRGTYLENDATFFDPKMAWRVASTATVNLDEKKFIVVSGASVYMMSKMDLPPEELETVKVS